MVPQIGLQCLIVAFPGHTLFLVEKKIIAHKTSIIWDGYACANSADPGQNCVISSIPTFLKIRNPLSFVISTINLFVVLFLTITN